MSHSCRISPRRHRSMPPRVLHASTPRPLLLTPSPPSPPQALHTVLARTALRPKAGTDLRAVRRLKPPAHASTPRPLLLTPSPPSPPQALDLPLRPERRMTIFPAKGQITVRTKAPPKTCHRQIRKPTLQPPDRPEVGPSLLLPQPPDVPGEAPGAKTGGRCLPTPNNNSAPTTPSKPAPGSGTVAIAALSNSSTSMLVVT